MIDPIQLEIENHWRYLRIAVPDPERYVRDHELPTNIFATQNDGDNYRYVAQVQRGDYISQDFGPTPTDALRMVVFRLSYTRGYWINDHGWIEPDPTFTPPDAETVR